MLSKIDVGSSLMKETPGNPEQTSARDQRKLILSSADKLRLGLLTPQQVASCAESPGLGVCWASWVNSEERASQQVSDRQSWS